MWWLAVIGFTALLFIPFKSTPKPVPQLEWDASQKVGTNMAVQGWVGAKLSRINFAREKEVAREIVRRENIKTPQDVLNYVKKLRHIADPLGGIGDIQYSISEILARGGGDCDDFAHLSCQLLSVLGFKSYYVTMVDALIKYSHTVCLFIQNNKVYVIDQQFIQQVKSEKDLLAFYNKFFPKAKYYVIDIRNSWGKLCEIGE